MENEKVIIISDKQTLRELFEQVLRNDLDKKNDSDFESDLKNNPSATKFDRRRAAKFLGVSYQTMHNWTKSGIIKEHGHGRKKFYLRSELIEAMKNKG